MLAGLLCWLASCAAWSAAAWPAVLSRLCWLPGQFCWLVSCAGWSAADGSALLARQLCWWVSSAGWAALRAGQLLVGQLLVGQLVAGPLCWAAVLVRGTFRDIQSAHSTQEAQFLVAKARTNPRPSQSSVSPVSNCAWQPCTGAMLICSVSFQF